MTHAKALPQGLTRRELLCRSGAGFGGLALVHLLASEGLLASGQERALHPLAEQPPHFEPKAKAVILLFMDGGPSQVDTFDPKPRLTKEHGQPIKMTVPATLFNDNGNVMGSPWEFRKYGKSGTEVSALFPHVATCVDDIAVIRSMRTDNSEHTAANYMLHTGSALLGRPSMGGWITYGLGSPSEDLPGFVVLDGGQIPPGGRECFGGGFLPAAYQGTLFRPGLKPITNIERQELWGEIQNQKLDALRKLNHGVMGRLGSVTEIDAAVTNYSLAFKMQSAVPALLDIKGESKATLELYGVNEGETDGFGRQCLLARRMVERGVRFVQLLTPSAPGGPGRWDHHANLQEGHKVNARATDKPIAGLLKDLKARGMLSQTLVVWGGEFGRTPMAQGNDGRDHNPYGFSMWLAGGGVKSGIVYGATDEYGYFAIENKVHTHDLHATMLHLLGLDHKKLTFRFGGRDMRLTDVHGEVVHGILA